MKKLLTVLVLCCIVAGLSYSQVTFGPKLGANFSTYYQNVSDSEDKEDFTYKLGPAVGIAFNIPLSDLLALQTGLSFMKKGASFDTKKWEGHDDVTSVDGYQRINVGYLEIPVNLAFCFDAGAGQFQLFLGAYLAYGLSGWIKSDYTINYTDGSTFSEDDDIKILFKNELKIDEFEDNAGYMKPLDYGLNFGIGYQINKVLFNLGYSLGLQNLSTKVVDATEDFYNDTKVYNRVIYINMAILLPNK